MVQAGKEAGRGGRTGPAVLAAIVILAAALRVYGLRWGLPNSLHDYSYHPDEFLLIGTGLFVMQQALIPRFYNYPSLYVYLSALAITLAAGYGAASTGAGVYLAARVVTVIMGVGAVAVTYWAGAVLFGRSAAALAALILAIAPLHVQHSHFATVDVPSTLFVAAALGGAGVILSRGSLRSYLLAGAAAGLAAGTKYNAGLVLLALIAAHVLSGRKVPARTHISRLLALVLGAGAAFVVSTPGAILRPLDFWHGVSYELAHSASGHGLVFAGTGSGFVYTFASSLWYGLGPGLAVAFAAAAVYALWRRDRGALVALAFVVPYYVLISLSQVRFARYALPLFPAAAVLIGWMAHDLYARLIDRHLFGVRAGVAALIVLVPLATLAYTAIVDCGFGGPDPRDTAAGWAFKNVPGESRIGVMEAPWFYSPPLSENLGFGTLPEREDAAHEARYEFVIFAHYDDPDSWWSEGNGPDWVILSDYEMEDALRLRNNRSISASDRQQVDRVLGNLEMVVKHYDLRKQFECPYEGLFARLPHDMRYACPTIMIYGLRR